MVWIIHKWCGKGALGGVTESAEDTGYFGQVKTASQDQRGLLGTGVRLNQAMQMANTMISDTVTKNKGITLENLH